jgi:hypothetical protein
MKSRITLLGLIAVLLWGGRVRGGGEPAWRSYTSTKGGFSVLMPGTPRERTRTVKTPYDTLKSTMVEFLDRRKGCVFAIDFVDLPEDMVEEINIDDFLDLECELVLRGTRGKVRNQKNITLGRLPGREVEAEHLQGKAISRTRLFLVGRRLFHLTALVPKDLAPAGHLNKFLDSFRLDQDRKEIRLEVKDGTVTVEGQLTRADPTDTVRKERHCKVYTLKLAADKNYTIDLESKEFDAYLRLENNAGEQLAEDDDSGSGLNARLVFRAPREGTYRIIATTYRPGATGNFTLTVRE